MVATGNSVGEHGKFPDEAHENSNVRVCAFYAVITMRALATMLYTSHNVVRVATANQPVTTIATYVMYVLPQPIDCVCA